MNQTLRDALTQPAPPSETCLSIITARVWGLRANAENVANDLSGIRDRVFGAVPTAVGADCELSSPGNDLACVHSALDALELEITRLIELAPQFGRL